MLVLLLVASGSWLVALVGLAVSVAGAMTFLQVYGLSVMVQCYGVASSCVMIWYCAAMLWGRIVLWLDGAAFHHPYHAA